MRRARIAVAPSLAAASRPRLLAALEEAYPVSFVEGNADGVDGWIGFDAAAPAPVLVPALKLASAHPTGVPAGVRFADADGCDRRLRGRELEERAEIGALAEIPEGAQVLASVDAGPVWCRLERPGGPLDLAAVAPPELEEDELLKHRLEGGRFVGLLPLVDLIRRLTQAHDFRPPPLRALLMFDDPNLRWTSYGYIDYGQLADHARAHGYHAAMAMIPLSAAVVHPGAARLFAAPDSPLSLLIHGIEHRHRELMAPLGESERNELVARAMRQIERFEARSSVPVSRVLCPPHGEASEAYLRTWLRFGLEAMLANVPYPWQGWQRPWGPPLGGWHPSTWVAGGLPIVRRWHFSDERAELVFRAYLDQPLVVYGHHDDVRDGLDVLAEMAGFVDGLGEVSWQSAGAIARSNFAQHLDGDVLNIRLHSRLVEVNVPEGVRAVNVSLPFPPEEHPALEVRIGSAVVDVPAGGPPMADMASRAAPGPMRISVSPVDRLDPSEVVRRRGGAWAVMRSVLTEGRDRTAPYRGRLRGRTVSR